MENFAARYGDRPLFQTEFAKGESEPLTFSDAMNLALLMHNSLTVEGVSAYLYWELFWREPKGLVSLDNPWQANPGYTINHTYYAFKQYSAFTDPGWHRIEASTDSNDLRISAFINPDVNDVSIIIINASDTDIDLSLSLGDFIPESCEVYRTSETEHTTYVGTFDQSQPLTLPPQTITTISLMGTAQEQNEEIPVEDAAIR
jgi:glucuronoarabinoxylan endo-1,4-beta-xylanase